jgi:lipoate-protein ligase A
MTRPWRLLRETHTGPAEQMALDEALLTLGNDDPGAVAVRLYTWRPAGFSYGFFQKLEQVPEANDPRLPADAVRVRRLTGGGAIVHGPGELTFSIATSAEHPLYRGGIEGSYERVHDALGAALAELGLPSERRGDRELASEQPGSGLCFHVSAAVDLVWRRADGQWAKGVGSAQRRSGGRVLHHGSIKCAVEPSEPGTASLADAGVHLTPDELAEELIRRWPARLGCRFERGDATDAELAHRERRAPLFSSEALLRRDPEAIRSIRAPRASDAGPGSA